MQSPTTTAVISPTEKLHIRVYFQSIEPKLRVHSALPSVIYHRPWQQKTTSAMYRVWGESVHSLWSAATILLQKNCSIQQMLVWVVERPLKRRELHYLNPQLCRVYSTLLLLSHCPASSRSFCISAKERARGPSNNFSLYFNHCSHYV